MTTQIPTYVVHDEKRWFVVRMYREDGEDWYDLRKYVPALKKWRTCAARVLECHPYVRPRVRMLKGDPGEAIRIAVKGRRRKFDTTIGGIYSLLCEAAGRKKLRDRETKTGRRHFT